LRNGTGSNDNHSRFYVRIVRNVGGVDNSIVDFSRLAEGTTTSIVFQGVSGTYVDNYGSGTPRDVTYKLQFNRDGYQIAANYTSLVAFEAKK
jgi:hypothetical protein